MSNFIYIIHSKNYDIDGADTVYKLGCTTDIQRRKFDPCYTTAFPYECKYIAYWDLGDLDCHEIETMLKRHFREYKITGNTYATEIFKLSSKKLINDINDFFESRKILVKFHLGDDIIDKCKSRKEELIDFLSEEYLENPIQSDITSEYIVKQVIVTPKVLCHKCKRLTGKPFMFTNSTGEHTYYGYKCGRDIIDILQIKRKPAAKKLVELGFSEDDLKKLYMLNDNLINLKEDDPKLRNPYLKPINELLFGNMKLNNFISEIDKIDEKDKYKNSLLITTIYRAEVVALYTFIKWKQIKYSMEQFMNLYKSSLKQFKKEYDSSPLFQYTLRINKTYYFRIENENVNFIPYLDAKNEIYKVLDESCDILYPDNNIIVNFPDNPEINDDGDEIFNHYKIFYENPEFINFLNNKITIITGGPGTGKSTLAAKALIPYLNLAGYDIRIAAPTAIAAYGLYDKATDIIKELISKFGIKRIEIGEEPYTIHKLFGIKPDRNDKPIAYFIDEISMLNISILAKFIKNIRKQDKIIFIGDIGQLPPVNGVSCYEILSDKYKNNFWDLTKRHRSNKELYNIFDNVQAGLINLGESFGKSIIRKDKNIDHNIASYHNINIKVNKNIAKNIVARIWNWFEIKDPSDLEDIMIITHTNDLVNDINKEVRNKFGYKEKFVVGDKILFIKNSKKNGYNNGNTGIITKIEQKNWDTKLYHINLGNKQKQNIIKLENIDNIVDKENPNKKHVTYGYAMTVHKAQGKECEKLCYIRNETDDKKLVYTAVTRVKKHLRIINLCDSNNQPMSMDNKRDILIKRINECIPKSKSSKDASIMNSCKDIIGKGGKISIKQSDCIRDILQYIDLDLYRNNNMKGIIDSFTKE